MFRYFLLNLRGGFCVRGELKKNIYPYIGYFSADSIEMKNGI